MLKNIVAHHSSKNEDGEIIVNLQGLEDDKNFRASVVNAILQEVSEASCVLFPSFSTHQCGTPLGKIINELALSLQVKTLVTGDVTNITSLQSPVKEVLIIKQSFKKGQGLIKQINELKEMGCKVRVVCLIAHSSNQLDYFRYATNVDTKALICLDEIPYLKE